MEKDLFDYLLVPTKAELRKECCIDKMYSLPTLNIPKSGWFREDIQLDYLVNEAIINYNNEIVIAKYNFCSAIKYHKYFINKKDDNFEFWSRKYLEQTIKELFSIYDKSMHILNYLFDLKVITDLEFKKNIRDKLKILDKDKYKKVNRLYSKLYGDKFKNNIRDNITHNSSELFERFEPVYKNNKTSWIRKEGLPYDEIIKLIEDICNILGENRDLLHEFLLEKYSPKGSD